MYPTTIGQVELYGPILALAGSIIVAFLGATLLETRRQKSMRETEKKALREAIYNEISYVITYIFAIIGLQEDGADPKAETIYKLHTWKDFAEDLELSLQAQVYSYTRQNPTLFYQLEDALIIDSFYQRLQATLRLVKRNAAEEATPAPDSGKQILDYNAQRTDW